MANSRRARRFKRVKKKYGPKCWYCPRAAQTVDHYIPVSMGGISDIVNYRPACLECNSIKSSMHPDLFWTLINEFGYAWQWSKRTRTQAAAGKFDDKLYEQADEDIRTMKQEMAKEREDEANHRKKHHNKVTWRERQEYDFASDTSQKRATPEFGDSFSGLPRTRTKFSEQVKRNEAKNQSKG